MIRSSKAAGPGAENDQFVSYSATSPDAAPGPASRPRLLDLFCGAGGATKGYQEAGFYVVGVDINPQPRYVGEEFIQGDALVALESLLAQGLSAPVGFKGSGAWQLGDFEAIHASPPCQAYSSITQLRGSRSDHPELIEPVRNLLEGTGLPYVIENVPGAPLADAIQLCGSHFRLAIAEGELRRHRLFECNFPLEAPPKCRHPRGRKTLGVYGGGTRQTSRPQLRNERGWIAGGTTDKANLAQAHELMGTPWMTRQEMTQAIPPAYTEYVGERLLRHLNVNGAGLPTDPEATFADAHFDRDSVHAGPADADR